MARILLLILASVAQAQTAFEAVSITAPSRPNTRLDSSEFVCRQCSLRPLILQAYRFTQYQLSIPSSMENYYFDVVARLPQGTSGEQVPLMIQALLADRFQLVIRREQKEKQVYELTVAEGGPKFHEAGTADPAGSDPDDDFEGTPGFLMKPGRIQMKRQPIGVLVPALAAAMQSSKLVIDATGLKAKYDLTLNWKYVREIGGGIPTSGEINAALRSQLGLKLKQEKRPIEIVVVEHVRKPEIEK